MYRSFRGRWILQGREQGDDLIQHDGTEQDLSVGTDDVDGGNPLDPEGRSDDTRFVCEMHQLWSRSNFIPWTRSSDNGP